MYHQGRSDDVLFLKYKVRQTGFFVILDHFCSFTVTLTIWKIKILKKWKKTPEEIITLNICIINDNHIMYGFWDKDLERQFFVILSHFIPFYFANNLQNQNFEKCEEGRAHLRTFYFGIYWWTWKTNYLKNCLFFFLIIGIQIHSMQGSTATT